MTTSNIKVISGDTNTSLATAALSDGDIVYNTTDSSTYVCANGILSTLSSGSYSTTVSAYPPYNTSYGYSIYDNIIDIDTIFSVMTEEEIVNILSILETRLTKEDYARIVKKLVLNSVFSEKFLLDNINHLSEDVIMTKHARQIKSGEYESLAALYMLNK